MQALQQGQCINNFTVKSIETVAEIDGIAYTMDHPSGAQLLYLDTEDEDKGFAIGFRTHPADNTGVFHILEHSVLCGSDKYPVKKPFVQLLKSSMNTFLNAFTAPDCTVFPATSTNEKDLMNLMGVYLDAVFHPAILHEPRIFKQEGWHYEYDGKDLSINGVVYNEMQGALAQPSTALMNALREELFPDTSYRFASGGVPGEIENLSYGQFVDTYKRHYIPDNCAIALYGRLDINAFLAAINEQLLSVSGNTNTPSIDAPNPRGTQMPTVSTDRKLFLHALPQDATLEFGSVFADANDSRRAIAMLILGHALLGNSESPLYRMLIDTGISTNITFRVAYLGSFLLTISAHDVKPDSASTFLEALKGSCQKLLSQGLQKDLLESSAFKIEFDERTNRGNGRPSAADRMMSCLARWGSGGNLDAEALRYEADLEFLKSAIATDYYDKLLKEAILDSPHYALVELCPTSKEQQNNRVREEALAAPEYGADDLARIASEAADLKAFQNSPDSQEALLSIPQLDRADCLTAPYYAGYKHVKEASFDVLRHEYTENGIVYAIRYYDISSLSLEDLHYVKTLLLFISETDTTRHNASEVIKLKNGRLGFINADTFFGTNELDKSLCAYAWVYTCSLANDIEFASDFIDEILHETLFESRSKLRETIDSLHQHLKQLVVDMMPHIIASTRSNAHIKGSAVLADAVAGYDAYEFVKNLKDLCANDAGADETLKRLEIVCNRAFGSRPTLISFSGDDDAYRRFIDVEQSIIPKYEQRATETLSNLSKKGLTWASHPTLAEVQPFQGGDEAFVIPGDVAFCASSIDVSNTKGFKSGHWRVANNAATFDYLWNSVRMKGGAYGVNFAENTTGIASFQSFRDPNVDDTLRCFDGLGAWLREFEPTDSELDGFVIAATGELDKPSKGFSRLAQQSRSYLRGYTLEDRARMRQEIVTCTANDVRQLGEELEGCAEKRSSVVFASRELIEQSKHSFVVKKID